VVGGIGSGKSAAARLLAGPRGLVLDADRLAHEVLDEPETRSWLRERLGPAVLGPDGRVDRAAIARAVFAPQGEELRRELEGFTHPRVRARIMARLGEARAAGVEPIVLDVPLLLENDAQHGLARLCDALVFVDVPDEERERRVRRDRGWPAGERARRESAQLPLAEKRRRAQHVLPNHGSPRDLERAAQALIELLHTPPPEASRDAPDPT